MENFFTDHTENTNKQVTSKKRTRVVNEIDHELKQKARLYCSSAEQWKIVSRYGNERLKDFCDNHEFRQQGDLNQTVFSFVQRAMALAIDLIAGGNGYIQTEIENDVSLRKSIELEAGNFVSLLSNKVKIISLLTVDSANGKMNQRRDQPTLDIVEVKNEQQPNECLFESTDFPGEFGGPETTPECDEGPIPGIDCGQTANHDFSSSEGQRQDHGITSSSPE